MCSPIAGITDSVEAGEHSNEGEHIGSQVRLSDPAVQLVFSPLDLMRQKTA